MLTQSVVSTHLWDVWSTIRLLPGKGGGTMQRSTERLLTMQGGSLPRPDGLRVILIAKDDGHPYDQARFTTRVHSAVAKVVQQQIAAVLDII